MKNNSLPTFYEFFAGGGMARAGLGRHWRCMFANDFDQMKAAAYTANWSDADFRLGDVASVKIADLQGKADLAWASFPCQDLSLAGDRRGLGSGETLSQTRSGAFWPFWSLMRGLVREGRGPRTIVLENVLGALTSHEGTDFETLCAALVSAGYQVGAMVIDAKLFVPQSRQRLFIVAVESDRTIPEMLLSACPVAAWHPIQMVDAVRKMPQYVRDHWIWWNPAIPPKTNMVFADIVEDDPSGVGWHSPEQTRRLLEMMSPLNQLKVEKAKRQNRPMIGCVYRRMRPDSNGIRQQRAEIRFDDVAGCLRTPGGGSSRQTIVIVSGNEMRSRLLSPREAARLMGLDDNYLLPPRYNDAYHLAGDGVCVPVVRHLAANLIEPLLDQPEQTMIAAQ